jgi:hypothetical protein
MDDSTIIATIRQKIELLRPVNDRADAPVVGRQGDQGSGDQESNFVFLFLDPAEKPVTKFDPKGPRALEA